MLPNIFVSSLAQTLSVGGNDTSIQLSTIYTQDGQVVATADFATFGRGIITVNPTSFSNAEFISFTGITPGTSPAGTLTGTLRGLSFKGNTQIAANQKFNVVGTPVIISFGTHNIQDLVTYINNIAIAGAPNASTTVKGITTLSVAPVLATNPIAVGTNDTRIPSTNTSAALAGSQSIPSATNLFITQDNVYDNTYDQQQTTQNGTIDFGDANTTGNKYAIAQKFYPAKTKIRGVHLYKAADTGTFTGTVTFYLEPDNGSGSPGGAGAAVASVTLTNAQWEALSVGEVEIVFSSEYDSLTVGSPYWIVMTTSTADSSNHPNVGTNTAGGYTNGVVKYYNATDGWVTVANIDLYFKTLEGVVSQVDLIPKAPKTTYFTTQTLKGDTSTVYNITNPSGSTFTYTYSSGTNPGNFTTFLTPGYSLISIQGTSLNAYNRGIFLVTAVTSSSFSVTNASGVVQSGISLTNGYLDIGITYTPSAGIKYVEIEAVGSGSSGGTTQYNGGDSVVGNFIAVAGGSNSKMSNVGDFISPGSTGFS